MNRIILAAVALGVLLLPARGAAQRAPVENPWTIETFAGAFQDAYDISPDGASTAMHLGLRIGYDLGSRTRLLGTLGYAKSRDISEPYGLPDHFVYDGTWALTTLGGEYDVIPGRTRVSLGVQMGAGWRRIDNAGQVGSPQAWEDVYGGGGFSPTDVIAPGITVRRDLSSRVSVGLGVQDHMFDVLEGPAEHSASVTLGVSLR